MLRLLFASFGLLLATPAGFALARELPPTALDYYLPAATADYDPPLPTPRQSLGFEIGEWHLHHHELLQVLEPLATLSDRVTLTEYARSHDRRPLVLLTITSPENHARLEEIRQANLALANALFFGPLVKSGSSDEDHEDLD